MNRKNILALIMALVICLTMLAGCADSSTDTSGDSAAKADSEEIEIDGIKVTPLSCEFDNELLGIDEELAQSGFTKLDGKVYVNLALKIVNNGTEDFTEDDISAYFEYNGLRYDMQYELMTVKPASVNDDDIPVGYAGVVYLFYVVEEAATEESITVHYTIKGNEYEKEVAPLDTRTAFEKKTELSVGDKLDIDGIFEIEVISCSETEYLRAENYAETDQYGSYGDKFIDLVLKVNNKTDVDAASFYAYTVVDDVRILSSSRIETDDNTKLKDISLKAGEEGIIHLFVAVDENLDTTGMSMRLNILENCYYCVVE